VKNKEEVVRPDYSGMATAAAPVDEEAEEAEKEVEDKEEDELVNKADNKDKE